MLAKSSHLLMSISVIMLKLSWMGVSGGEGRLRFPELVGEEDAVRRAIGRIWVWFGHCCCSLWGSVGPVSSRIR